MNNGRYADIKFNDVGNGKGIRVSFWVQGCDIKCKGCHNSSIWDFDGGKPFDKEVIDKVLDNINNNGVIRNLSILGGEPMHERNIGMVLDLVYAVKKHYPKTNIWLWSGYTYEAMTSVLQQLLLQYIDVLIDGRFEVENRDLSLKYRGSSNQRVIDMEKTLKNNKIILYNGGNY